MLLLLLLLLLLLPPVLVLVLLVLLVLLLPLLLLLLLMLRRVCMPLIARLSSTHALLLHQLGPMQARPMFWKLLLLHPRRASGAGCRLRPMQARRCCSDRSAAPGSCTTLRGNNGYNLGCRPQKSTIPRPLES